MRTLRGEQGMKSRQQRLKGNVRICFLCSSVQHHSLSHVETESQRVELLHLADGPHHAFGSGSILPANAVGGEHIVALEVLPQHVTLGERILPSCLCLEAFLLEFVMLAMLKAAHAYNKSGYAAISSSHFHLPHLTLAPGDTWVLRSCMRSAQQVRLYAALCSSLLLIYHTSHQTEKLDLILSVTTPDTDT